MSNDLIMQDASFSLAPRNLSEAMEFAKIIASSDMVPKDYVGKPGNVLVAVQTGAELGLKPMQSLQGIAVISGRPCVWGDAMWALILSHPEYEDSKETPTNTECTVYLKRRGKTARTVVFSLEDAKKAGLLGKSGPWSTAPKRMMQMRARTFAARDLFADALKGIKSVEEVRDYSPEPEKEIGSGVHQPVDDGKFEEQKQFEEEHLQTLRDAALNGLQALQTAFTSLPKGSAKDHLWKEYGPSLKAAAMQAGQQTDAGEQ